jgi:uncharacterized protein (TIGR02145 family)
MKKLMWFTSLLFLISCEKDNKNDVDYSTAFDLNNFQTFFKEDIEGNRYHAVKVGKQTWMLDNLSVTKYNDGSPIRNIKDNTLWMNSTTSGYCWPINDIQNKEKYGALYNWYTVNTGKLCPAGWHVPSDEDFAQLIDFLGNDTNGAANLTKLGLISYLAGCRLNDGTFTDKDRCLSWWTVTEGADNSAWVRDMCTSGINLGGFFASYKTFGMSVKCVKNK